jgi:hypothetical protein
MGGNIQPQGHAQIMANIIDFGMNPQEAGDAARYTHSGSSQPTGTLMTDGGRTQLEAGVCAAVRTYRLARSLPFHHYVVPMMPPRRCGGRLIRLHAMRTTMANCA